MFFVLRRQSGGNDRIQTRGLRFYVVLLLEYSCRLSEGVHTHESVETAGENFIRDFAVTDELDVSDGAATEALEAAKRF